MSTVVILALLPRGFSARAQQNPGPQPRATIPDLGEFWPLDAPSRRWKVTAHADVGAAHPRTLMWIENETIGPGEFILWFTSGDGPSAGQRHGEQYRVCRLPGTAWLFLDTYIDSSPGKPRSEHHVASDRILFTPANGAAVDLVSSGVYQACGETGQPYLVWSGAPAQYRIQVWGHLKESPARFKWYWDAIVSGPEAVTDDCIRPIASRPAIRVEEAWWATFKNPPGAWGIGSGQIDPANNLPTGVGIKYGRTVWHGAGQLPYLMMGPGRSPSNSRWCISEVTPTPGK